jgi:drug/metabolite transporter superfamily protein YnfA
VVVELGLFLGGLYLYLKDTRPKDRTGTWALASFVALMLVLWIGAVFGPPPPNQLAVKMSGVAIWLAIPWAYWIDRHRENQNPLAANLRE